MEVTQLAVSIQGSVHLMRLLHHLWSRRCLQLALAVHSEAMFQSSTVPPQAVQRSPCGYSPSLELQVSEAIAVASCAALVNLTASSGPAIRCSSEPGATPHFGQPARVMELHCFEGSQNLAVCAGASHPGFVLLPLHGARETPGLERLIDVSLHQPCPCQRFQTGLDPNATQCSVTFVAVSAAVLGTAASLPWP